MPVDDGYSAGELKDAGGAPAAGVQSFFRGAAPVAYDEQTRATIVELRDELDVGAVTAVWDRALASAWTAPPVWFHGDVVIAWTLLHGRARDAFRDALDLDDDTWDRGRGWALWKALITVAEFRTTRPSVAEAARAVLAELLA